LNSGRLDGKGVHQSSVTACLRSPGDGPQRRQEVRTFGTTTRELLGLADWLTAAGCTHVAMESTGVYWRPIYNLLEVRFALSVVNAQHVKMVPGRKTAGRDSECRAQLLELGLLRRRFVPPAAQRERLDVVRYRKRLIEARAREANRVLLETANIEPLCKRPRRPGMLVRKFRGISHPEKEGARWPHRSSKPGGTVPRHHVGSRSVRSRWRSSGGAVASVPAYHVPWRGVGLQLGLQLSCVTHPVAEP
jgi:Transposase